MRRKPADIAERPRAGMGAGRSGLLPRPITARNRSTLRSSQSRQFGLVSSRLVVATEGSVETHRRVPPAGAHADAHRWAAFHVRVNGRQ